MECFSCVNCSLNCMIVSDNPCSLIMDVLAGKCLTLSSLFYIMQHWFSSYLSLKNRFILAFLFLIKSSVSATMVRSFL